MSLEFVLLTPVLVILVVLVLWAGGTGQARLVADLAAEEAATAAALCCEPGDEIRQERVVEAILSGRPELSRLCVTDPRPLGDRFVTRSFVPLGTEEGEATGGVGVLAVGFGCETDGGVGGPGTIFPAAEIRGRASEVVLLSAPEAQGNLTRPVLTVADAATSEGFDSLTFVLTLSEPVVLGREISLFYRLRPFDEADPASVLNAAPAVTGETPFDFCGASIDDIGGTYNPVDYAHRHRDYLQTTGHLLISRSETSATITVPIFDDCLYEADESFRLELYNENEDDVVIARREAVGTIRNDDEPPVVAFRDTSGMLRENPANPANRELLLDLTLLSPSLPRHPAHAVLPISGTAVTVDGTASGTADGACPPDFRIIGPGGADGTFPNPSVGNGNQIRVEVLDDDIYEGPELFEVRLESATGAELGVDQVVTVTIRDGDPKPFLAFLDSGGSRLDRLTLPEDAGEVRFRVGLADSSRNPTVSGVPVTFSASLTDFDATAGQDYEADVGASGEPIGPCASGSALPEITITVLDDNVVEPKESFSVRLSSDNGNAKDIQLWADIVDND